MTPVRGGGSECDPNEGRGLRVCVTPVRGGSSGYDPSEGRALRM